MQSSLCNVARAASRKALRAKYADEGYIELRRGAAFRVVRLNARLNRCERPRMLSPGTFAEKSSRRSRQQRVLRLSHRDFYLTVSFFAEELTNFISVRVQVSITNKCR